jgi:hypothetical protein
MKPVVLKASWFLPMLPYRFVTRLSCIIVQLIIPHRVTSMSEVTVQAYVTCTVDYTEHGCLIHVLQTTKCLSDPKNL